MVNQKVLENIGLTASEAKIYIVLLEQGSSLAGTISRNTGIHRRCVYDAIERLIQKGLVSYIKTNNRKYFEAVDPEHLLEILKSQKDDVDNLIPELKLLQQLSKDKKETLFFRGKASIKSAFDDQLLNAEKEIIVIGASKKIKDVLPFYVPHYEAARISKKIHMKMLFVESEKDSSYVSELKSCTVRFVPNSASSNSSIYVYGDNTAIIVWKEDPIAILIREKELALFFQAQFKLLWEMAKE